MIIDEARVRYHSFEEVYCPYIRESIHFTSKGFNHLIYKTDRTRRTEAEIKARLDSLKYIKEIISKSGTLQEREVTDNGRVFYAFIAILDDKKYKVVVSNTKEGKYVFVSIIPRWKTSRRDEKLKTKNSSR